MSAVVFFLVLLMGLLVGGTTVYRVLTSPSIAAARRAERELEAMQEAQRSEYINQLAAYPGRAMFARGLWSEVDVTEQRDNL